MARERTGTLVLGADGNYKARVTIPRQPGEKAKKRNRPWVYLGTPDAKVALRRLDRELERIAAGYVPGDGEIIDPTADTAAEFFLDNKVSLALGDQVLLGAHLVPAKLGVTPTSNDSRRFCDPSAFVFPPCRKLDEDPNGRYPIRARCPPLLR